jgi:hypothetical protein
MHGWYEKAGVRGHLRRILDEDRETGLTLFPESQIPYLRHEGLADLSPVTRQALVARHLYQYLMFTVHLETKAVNRGVAMVAHGEVDFTVDPETRLDAFKIYCDEGYHALYSLDIIQQIEATTGIAALPYDFQPRLDRLDRTGDRFLPEHPALAKLLQVVVFETVVTSILSDVPRDPTVYRVVREVVGDHARDEAHHHAFFVTFFRELWANLPASLRRDVARSLPHFVDDCLRPDLAPIRASLHAAGLAAPLVEDVLDDCYSEEAMRAAVRAGSRHTVRLFEDVGALDVPGVDVSLQDLGLAR